MKPAKAENRSPCGFSQGCRGQEFANFSKQATTPPLATKILPKYWQPDRQRTVLASYAPIGLAFLVWRHSRQSFKNVDPTLRKQTARNFGSIKNQPFKTNGGGSEAGAAGRLWRVMLPTPPLFPLATSDQPGCDSSASTERRRQSATAEDLHLPWPRKSKGANWPVKRGICHRSLPRRSVFPLSLHYGANLFRSADDAHRARSGLYKVKRQRPPLAPSTQRRTRRTDFPNFIASGALSSVKSPDGKTLLVLVSGYNSLSKQINSNQKYFHCTPAS